MQLISLLSSLPLSCAYVFEFACVCVCMWLVPEGSMPVRDRSQCHGKAQPWVLLFTSTAISRQQGELSGDRKSRSCYCYLSPFKKLPISLCSSESFAKTSFLSAARADLQCCSAPCGVEAQHMHAFYCCLYSINS